MASVGFLIAGTVINALEHKAEKRFTDLNSAMQQYFLVTGRQSEPLPPKPVLSNF